MTKPVRLQLSRKKGFDLQAWSREVNGLPAVNVARPSKWGNPFKVGEPSGWKFKDSGDPTPMIAALSVEQVVEFYRDAMRGFILPEMHPYGHKWAERWIKHAAGHAAEFLFELRGKNLACYCKADQTCHADVLLEMANWPAGLTMFRPAPPIRLVT